MRKLRIIQVVNVRWFNATAWYGLYLSRLLQDAGHEVRVIGLPGTSSWEKAREMDLDVSGMRYGPANPLVFGEIRSLIREFKPDLVNCHRGEGLLFWGLAKGRGPRFGLVRTRGDQRPPRTDPCNRLLHQRLVDAVIATNSRTAEEYILRMKLPPEKVHLVLGGVDRQAFRFSETGRQRVRAEYGIPRDTLVIGLLGRFDRVKGQVELIDSLARLSQKGLLGQAGTEEVRLLLAGFSTGLSEEAIRQYAAKAGLAHLTIFTGKRPDVRDVICAMDLGVIASQGSETIARAAFEIMSCGVPLIGTDVGVMPDLLLPHALVTPGDPEALSGILEKTILEPGFRDRLRQEQEEKIEGLSGRHFYENTLRVYVQALRNAYAGFESQAGL